MSLSLILCSWIQLTERNKTWKFEENQSRKLNDTQPLKTMISSSLFPSSRLISSSKTMILRAEYYYSFEIEDRRVETARSDCKLLSLSDSILWISDAAFETVDNERACTWKKKLFLSKDYARMQEVTVCLKSLAWFFEQCLFMFSLFIKTWWHKLQENAFLWTLSSEKANKVIDDCYIKANVSAAVNNEKEEICERSSCCFSFSASCL